MEKLIEEIEKLKKSLDNTTEVEKIIELNKKVKESKELQEVVDSVANDLGNEGRILVRPSGTEPLLRVMAEAPTDAEVHYYVDTIADVVRAEIGLD